MTKRKRYSAEFNANVALEAIKGEQAIHLILAADLSEQPGPPL